MLRQFTLYLDLQKTKLTRFNQPEFLISIEDLLPNSDAVQRIGSSLVNINETGLLDPLAQNFRVSGFIGGLFLSSIDLFFKSKQNPTETDTVRPVSVYLTETNGGLPTRNVIPFSEVTMASDTELRIKINTNVPSGETINAGETITGSVSGASGTVKSALTVTTTGTRYTSDSFKS